MRVDYIVDHIIVLLILVGIYSLSDKPLALVFLSAAIVVLIISFLSIASEKGEAGFTATAMLIVSYSLIGLIVLVKLWGLIALSIGSFGVYLTIRSIEDDALGEYYKSAKRICFDTCRRDTGVGKLFRCLFGMRFIVPKED